MHIKLKLLPEYWERHFMAQVWYETQGLKKLRESFNYSTEGLLKMWPNRFTPELAEELGRTSDQTASQSRIANLAYSGRLGNKLVGDGWRFRGRGWIMMTGRANYAEFGSYIGERDFVLRNPDCIAGEHAQLSAEWWFMENVVPRKPNTVLDVTRIVSGSGATADKRKAFFEDEPWIYA